jgi:exosortase/archaeosortase family protein
LPWAWSTFLDGRSGEQNDKDCGRTSALCAGAACHVSECVVTSASYQLSAPKSGLLATLRHAISRNELFAGLYVVGCINGLSGGVISSLRAGDWTGGAENISVIVLFACIAGISFFLHNKDDAVTSQDLVIALAFLALIAVPVSEVNWAAVSGLSLYILLYANDNSARKRGALILLAVTVPMLWSRVLFSFISQPFLDFDAWLAGGILGTHVSGNLVNFADGSGELVILPACASLANVSLAFLCWVSVSQWVEHRPARQDVFWCLLACASVVAANVTRIAIMGLSHWHYLTFHYGWGAMLFGTVILALTVGITMLGVRRELFSHT